MLNVKLNRFKRWFAYNNFTNEYKTTDNYAKTAIAIKDYVQEQIIIMPIKLTLSAISDLNDLADMFRQLGINVIDE